MYGSLKWDQYKQRNVMKWLRAAYLGASGCTALCYSQYNNLKSRVVTTSTVLKLDVVGLSGVRKVIKLTLMDLTRVI